MNTSPKEMCHESCVSSLFLPPILSAWPQADLWYLSISCSCRYIELYTSNRFRFVLLPDICATDEALIFAFTSLAWSREVTRAGGRTPRLSLGCRCDRWRTKPVRRSEGVVGKDRAARYLVDGIELGLNLFGNRKSGRKEFLRIPRKVLVLAPWSLDPSSPATALEQEETFKHLATGAQGRARRRRREFTITENG